ncbi:MAG: hypothetical protein QE263_06835 [Vampirovibrionales bacterium]|nr:hypothetical protein [Vampirovibrionales bacterium]
MAGLNVQSFASLFAAQAAKSLQGAGGVQAPKANQFLIPYKNDVADIKGNLSRPQNVKTMPGFGGVQHKLGEFDACC